MRQIREIAAEQRAMQTITDLASVLEGIASMRIAQIKNQVLQSKEFFNELWGIYQQLRVDDHFRFGREDEQATVTDKKLLIIITAEGGFSGDIDSRITEKLMAEYDPKRHDVIVIGHHGAVQLAQAGVRAKRYFKMPETDTNLNVTPIIEEVQAYADVTVFYQTYVSLSTQDVKSIALINAVKEQGKDASKSDDIISEATYIFEPSTYAVVGHLERSMLQIALGQVILESKLAQYASRFRAMSAAHSLAEDSADELSTLVNRARRAQKDERLKEVINGMRKAGVTA